VVAHSTQLIAFACTFVNSSQASISRPYTCLKKKRIYTNTFSISFPHLGFFLLSLLSSISTLLTRPNLIYHYQLLTPAISSASMCYYTVGEAIYEDCAPSPSHMVKCIIFEKCLLREDSRDICPHPGVRQPENVLKKHIKDGKCPICPKFDIAIRERYVAVPDSPESEHSFSSEKIDFEEES
jgi:hypothetical protein